MEGHEGELLVSRVPHGVFVCATVSLSSLLSLSLQMKLIIALVVFALLLIIISECLVQI